MSARHHPDDSAPNSKEFTLHMWGEDRKLRQNGRNFTFFPVSFSASAHQKLHIYIHKKDKFSVLKGFKQSAAEVGHYSPSLEC